jgi:peptidoglycan/LPS O-acetylase OafA/YrhL
MTLGEAYDPRANSIGSIRLACALAVIIGHASPFGGYGDTWLLELSRQQVSGARVAVDIFFILSGFLLASSIERGTIADFLRNRALRIFPGLWACLIITAILMPPLLGAAPSWDYVIRTWWLLGGVAHSIPGLFETHVTPSPNGALWTLTWECYCYLSLAVLMSVNARTRATLAVVIFIVAWAVFASQIIGAVKGKAAILSPFRLFAFFYSGVLLYQFRRWVPFNAAGAIICAACLVIAAAVGVATLPRQGGLFYIVAPPVLGYLVLYAAVRLPLQGFAENPDFSYGFYIYGTFVIQVLVSLGFGAENMSYGAFAALCVAATAPFAFASWYLVEAPAMLLRRKRPAHLAAALA